MENSARTRGILVLLILFACGALSLIVRTLEPAQATPGRAPERVQPTATYPLSPLATPTNALAPTLAPTPTFLPTHTPVPTNTQLPAPTPTETVLPTNTPTREAAPVLAATETPVPTDTPLPTATPSRAATAPPPPTPTPTVIRSLEMDWVLVETHCISAAQWFLEFWLTANGGNGEYTFYRDIERLHGPSSAFGFGYQMYTGTGSAAVGTFVVESGAQRVESKFWVERPDCSHLVTSSAPP